jgi:hypothetical protein
MRNMRFLSIVALTGCGLALALPGGSLAKLTEVGVIGETSPATVPSCPSPTCLAVSRTTGFQIKIGSTRNPLAVPRNGVIVAWTITLGKPNSTQIKFFNANEGGAASAGIAILRPERHVKLGYKLVSQSPVVQLQPYFGMSAQFPLATTLPVKKGDIVALTVPTWAPALSQLLSDGTSWLASRPRGGCDDTDTQTAHTQPGPTRYRCKYAARLTYSATVITSPTPNSTSK